MVVARPRVLPDGRAVVFQGPEVDSVRHVWLADLASDELTDLGIVGDNPRALSFTVALDDQQVVAPRAEWRIDAFDSETRRRYATYVAKRRLRKPRRVLSRTIPRTA